jgi:hypothetical protein
MNEDVLALKDEVPESGEYGPGADDEFGAQAGRLELAFALPAHAWTDSLFESWALTAFRRQFSVCAPYGAFCRLRGATPESVTTWEDVPPVPAAAFKHFDLISIVDGTPDRVFRTSGTTQGASQRGRHLVPRAGLYRASLIGPFREALLPEGQKLVFVSLIPPPDESPDSSLSFMVGAAADVLATETHWLVDGKGEWHATAEETLASLAGGGPVLLLGTALAFAHLIEKSPLHTALPEGSRIMETGGFKGARRSISRASLYEGISRATDVPVDRIVNEYGMTELLSQLYEPVLAEGPSATGLHRPPPWLRVRALDPTTLAPLPEGETGILAFFDLANLGSVSHVLTEDVGVIEGGSVRLRGRTLGAEPRGCSRAMDDLMSATARR